MYVIRYERYRNDYSRSHEVLHTPTLESLADWMFGKMSRPYSERGAMHFPTQHKTKDPYRIEFVPRWGGETYWIHQIENESGGIVFSDGTWTSGQKFWSQSVKNWLLKCEERRLSPQFKFVDEVVNLLVDPATSTDKPDNNEDFFKAVNVVCMECVKCSEDVCDSCPVRLTCDALRKEVK